jgi:hypothetical protein
MQLELFAPVAAGTLWQMDIRTASGAPPMVVRVVDVEDRSGWRVRYEFVHHPAPGATPFAGRTGALALRLFLLMYPIPVTEDDLQAISARVGKRAA